MGFWPSYSYCYIFVSECCLDVFSNLDVFSKSIELTFLPSGFGPVIWGECPVVWISPGPRWLGARWVSLYLLVLFFTQSVQCWSKKFPSSESECCCNCLVILDLSFCSTMLLSLASMSFAIYSVTMLVEVPASIMTQNLLCPYCMFNLDGLIGSAVDSIMFTVYSSTEFPYVEWRSGSSEIIFIPWLFNTLIFYFVDWSFTLLAFLIDLHTFA